MEYIFIKSKRIVLLLLSVIMFMSQSQSIFAANETTHFKWATVLALLSGLNKVTSNAAGKYNQAPDSIYGAAATHVGLATSLAGQKFHFPEPITSFNLENDSQKDYTVENTGGTKAIFIRKLFRKMTTNGVSTLNNAEAYELTMEGFRENDAMKAFTGAHPVTDASAFHANFKSTLRVGIISVPVGHMSNGVENDRQTVIRVKASTESLLAVYIAIRRRQEVSGVGVDTEWLNKLSNEVITFQKYNTITEELLPEIITKKVNINEPSEVATWLFSQPVVQKYLNELPVRTNPKYLHQAMQTISQYLKKHKVFLEDRMVDSLFKERSHLWYAQRMDEYQALRDLISIAWERGLLNETKILNDAFANPLTGATKLEQILTERITEGAATGADHERGQPEFGTRAYVLDMVVWTYGRGVVRIPYHRWHADYMIQDLQSFITRFENAGIDKIEFELFGQKSKFVENPRKSYWDKVWKHYHKSIAKKQEKLSFSEKSVIMANAIVNTQVSPDHTLVSYSKAEKYKLMTLFQKYLWGDYYNPTTAPGNHDLLYPEQREFLLSQLREKFGTDLISEKMYLDWLKHEKWINDAYNSKTPTTKIQKAAVWILNKTGKDRGGLPQSKILNCSAIFTKR